MGVNIINNFPPGSAGSGGYVSPVPEFTYSGQYQMLDDGNGDWRLKLLTSGVLTFLGEGDLLVDIFLVGGGGGGYRCSSSSTSGGVSAAYYYSSGGGGGYTLTKLTQIITCGIAYTTTIGAGGRGSTSGSAGASGGATSIGSYSVSGGAGGTASSGSGGSGGSGAVGTNKYPAYSAGGRDGANGQGGRGQGTTTREFGEPGGELYSNGGDCNYDNTTASPTYTETNHGHGGHGVSDAARNAGQPGVVIIRNHRRAA